MRRLRSGFVLVLVLSLFVLAGCGSAVGVRYAFDRSVTFASYRTFAMHEPNRPVPAAHVDEDPFVLQRLRQLAHAGLRKKGLAAVERKDADLVVVVLLGTKRRVELHSMGYPGFRYRGPVWGYDLHEYEEGTVVIDLVDRKKNSVVWRGRGTARVADRPTEDEMREMVTRILDGYPPGSSPS